ncbi:hypothetical protein Bhyg_10666 [Pseudolycoriella hygida]|uniref:Uncharacterized protein n=1 Tax=Pseudolycoriella hygida TaxID=35572 RepID=A0A9Q0RXL2_9DIPT|nr:hypothetical protein Bhyg_10666 [Pseudolycoriella hygida]
MEVVKIERTGCKSSYDASILKAIKTVAPE